MVCYKTIADIDELLQDEKWEEKEYVKETSFPIYGLSVAIHASYMHSNLPQKIAMRGCSGLYWNDLILKIMSQGNDFKMATRILEDIQGEVPKMFGQN